MWTAVEGVCGGFTLVCVLGHRPSLKFVHTMVCRNRGRNYEMEQSRPPTTYTVSFLDREGVRSLGTEEGREGGKKRINE